MYKKIKIVKVDSDYCNFLRKYDDKVSYNAGNKELRPFVGIYYLQLIIVSILLHFLVQSLNILN